jgi:hypothetical protein
MSSEVAIKEKKDDNFKFMGLIDFKAWTTSYAV